MKIRKAVCISHKTLKFKKQRINKTGKLGELTGGY